MTPTPTAPAPKGDRTQARRQHKRQSALDAVAQAHGFDTWRMLETAVKNGDVTITITHPGN